MFQRLLIWPAQCGGRDEDQPGSLFSRAFSITTMLRLPEHSFVLNVSFLKLKELRTI